MKRHLLPALFAALMMLCGTSIGANAADRDEDFGFGMRANLLRWATLTPRRRIGMESPERLERAR